MSEEKNKNSGGNERKRVRIGRNSSEERRKEGRRDGGRLEKCTE